ncbi:SirB1 family protein [Aliiglaciecola sp. M165]|uniref:SirB1 family protein n=1 Tax=Aliiglaciecola sp. M165 TaxID=2593649 RepID=UPI0021B0BA78|nr:tetratricopeptide repeat protein [Aliiglaciecola sp. M165]
MIVLEEHVNTLRQTIAQQNTLLASLLVAQHFEECLDINTELKKVSTLVQRAFLQVVQSEKHTEKERLDSFLKVFFTEFAFSGDENDYFNSKYSLVNQVLDYHTGIPVTLSIVFCAIAKELGFDASGVNFPGHFLVRVNFESSDPVYIDPLNGKSMSWLELEHLYASIVGADMEDDEMPLDVLEPASAEEVIVRLLHNLKASFIREQRYQKALYAVDLLIGLSPEDPYERRDRGFLLHQLECPQVAKADYQFFIKHCPQDPSAQLLKLQMRHWDSIGDLVFH